MKKEKRKQEVYFTVDIDGWTNGYQLSINDENGGYRIRGPKYNGSSKSIIRHNLTERDCNELALYLRKARRILRNEKKARDRLMSIWVNDQPWNVWGPNITHKEVCALWGGKGLEKELMIKFSYTIDEGKTLVTGTLCYNDVTDLNPGMKFRVSHMGAA